MNFPRYLCLIAVLLLGTPALVRAADGTVVFVHGRAMVESTGTSTQLKAGDHILPGQTVVTGEDGHVHIRFPDGGFAGVRPNSRFLIEAYAGNPDTGEDAMVRFRLDTGAVRSVTGGIIEKRKDRFRFNTPVAAIGVRGTDYLVQVEQDSTKVVVYRGAIVMAPLGGGCDAAALGPCDTSSARVLNDTMRDVYLQYRSGEVAPEVKRMPPGGGEGKPGSSSTMSTPPASNGQEHLELTTAGVAGELGVGDVPAAPPSVTWGRWSALPLPTPTAVSLMEQGYQPVYSNQLFSLLAKSTTTRMPATGAVGFRLEGAEAYAVTGNQYRALAVEGGSLFVDFGRALYRTGLDLTTDSGKLGLYANGKVSWQGFLLPDQQQSNMLVQGLLGEGGNDAGYLFSHRYSPTTEIHGATYWKH